MFHYLSNPSVSITDYYILLGGSCYWPVFCYTCNENLYLVEQIAQTAVSCNSKYAPLTTSNHL